LILQILHRNTAMTHLPHLSHVNVTASAYCQARRRLPQAVIKELVDCFNGQLDCPRQSPLWHGHRVFIADGSGFSMPDTPELQAHFGQPGNQRPGCGFPVAHMLALFDAESGFLRDVSFHPLRTQDFAHVAKLHLHMARGDILVGDRGFCSYAHLALLSQAQLHGVLRVHQKTIVDFRPHRRSAKRGDSKGRPRSRWLRRNGECDQIVEWRKPATRPSWMPQDQFDALPMSVQVRELKCHVRDSHHRVREVTLVTTLLDSTRYPARAVAELYRKRWQVEVDLRDLKATLGMDVLKGKSVDVVMKEAMIFVLVHNLIRLVMLEASRRQDVAAARVSFIDALRRLQRCPSAKTFPKLVINPRRPARFEPRCIKRHMKEYDLMTKPRSELRKRLKKQKKVA